MKQSFLLLMIFIANYSVSQNEVLTGYVLNSSTNDSIPYVNIVNLSLKSGTISNSNGKFKLNLKNASATDTIRFSSIGYKPFFATIQSLKNTLREQNSLKMDEDIQSLGDVVVVTKKKWKTKTYGARAKSTNLSVQVFSDLGAETGRVIEIPNKASQLLKFKAHVALNTYKSIKLRLNFYTISNGKPDALINTENIYIDFAKKRGKIIVDLEQYRLFVTDDFFVSLEWVDYYGDGSFLISATDDLEGFKFRFLGETAWEESPFKLRYNVLVKY